LKELAAREIEDLLMVAVEFAFDVSAIIAIESLNVRMIRTIDPCGDTRPGM
jgi:hypothetical protein